jgi:hypothetical protein
MALIDAEARQLPISKYLDFFLDFVNLCNPEGGCKIVQMYHPDEISDSIKTLFQIQSESSREFKQQQRIRLMSN